MCDPFRSFVDDLVHMSNANFSSCNCKNRNDALLRKRLSCFFVICNWLSLPWLHNFVDEILAIERKFQAVDNANAAQVRRCSTQPLVTSNLSVPNLAHIVPILLRSCFFVTSCLWGMVLKIIFVLMIGCHFCAEMSMNLRKTVIHCYIAIKSKIMSKPMDNQSSNLGQRNVGGGGGEYFLAIRRVFT